MKHGFTLLEVLVVTSIMIIVGSGAYFTFAGFRKQTVLEKNVSEFSYALKMARAKAIQGELVEGTTLADYKDGGMDTASLPVWKLSIAYYPPSDPNGERYEYKIIGSYIHTSGNPVNAEAEKHVIMRKDLLFTNGCGLAEYVFDRNTGNLMLPTNTCVFEFVMGATNYRRVKLRINGTFTIDNI